MWKVELSLVADWLVELDQDSYGLTMAAPELLAEHGPHLGRPLVDSIKGSRFKNMKELRPGSAGRSEMRVLFAFDPLRCAVLLVAGNKTGTWSRWYRVNVPLADQWFEAHLTRQERGRDQ